MKTELQSCRYCGCTDMQACPGGCYWVRPGYCSACAETHVHQIEQAAAVWEYDGQPKMLCGHPCTIVDEDESLTITDHLGVVALSYSGLGLDIAPQYMPVDFFPLFGIAAPKGGAE